MKFPQIVKIKIIDTVTNNVITVENIAINVHIFAINKNDYYLGPYFSNSNGEIHLTNRMLRISADAEMETGIMDYKDIREASPLVEIKILSKEEVARLKEGRMLWGLVAKEAELYRSDKELLRKIEMSNNYVVIPTSIKVLWNDMVSPRVCYELKTNYANSLYCS